MHLDGIDIAAAPLSERKALLQRLLQGADAHLAFSSHIDGDGDAAFQLAGAQHFEGIVSKRADRGYHGGRSDDWRKTKQLRSEEFAVVGYTAPKGSRSGFGSLLLARPDAEHGWLYVGRVGSGFSDALLREVTALIGKAAQRHAQRARADHRDRPAQRALVRAGASWWKCSTAASAGNSCCARPR